MTDHNRQNSRILDYSYDACGNMTLAVTFWRLADGHMEVEVDRRWMEWDDLGRLRSVDDNGFKNKQLTLILKISTDFY